jgi:hypothetical protein
MERHRRIRKTKGRAELWVLKADDGDDRMATLPTELREGMLAFDLF